MLFVFSNSLIGLSQSIIRRNYIIALDNNFKDRGSEVQLTVENLFYNKRIDGWEGDQNNLINELKNKFVFFETEKDNISFFVFNNSTILDGFNKSFLKKIGDWSEYKQNRPNSDITDFFGDAFNQSTNSSSRSVSNLLYPLILNSLDEAVFSEEYILIIISENVLQPLSSADWKTLDEILKDPAFSSNRVTVQSVKNKVDILNSMYEKAFYFNLKNVDANGRQESISAFKITPINFSPNKTAESSMKLNSNVSLQETGYQSKRFKFSGFNIQFPNNKFIEPSEVFLKIENPQNNTILFSDIIAKNNEGNLKSSYSDNLNLFSFLNSGNSITLKGLIIPISISNSDGLDRLNISMKIKAQTIAEDINPMNFVFYSNSILSNSNIEFYSENKRMLLVILPILCIIIIILVTIYLGEPRILQIKIDEYLDSFEIIDYKTLGRFRAPYKAWDSEKHKVDYLLIKGLIRYRFLRYPFNWKSPIYLKLNEINVPSGFNLFLKLNEYDLKEFGNGIAFKLNKIRNGEFTFIVGLRQNNINKEIYEPELVKFKVEAAIKDSKLFFKSRLDETIEYDFKIGPDLGDTWIAFDPGTTGSCVATGSSTNNIILGRDKTNKNIIPSVISFEKDANYIPNGYEIPTKIYSYGSKANALIGSSRRYQSFQSFKKLLGYKTTKEVKFTNNNVLHLTGSKLAGLLVEGLYNDLEYYVNRTGFDNREYLTNGKFKPLRAVVAIPNNFTITKTQDMVNCINSFSRFKEIRYIYEAEAVVCYYMSNYAKLNEGIRRSESETILVFDMGGATINASIVSVDKVVKDGRTKDSIDIVGKIGYGIGGDSIDYCIAKFLLSFKDEFPELGRIDMWDRKNELAELAFQIKKEIIKNYNKYEDYLITAFNLERFINSALNINIKINENESDMYKYFLKTSGKYRLFTHSLFTKIIFDNVKDAVFEVLELSGNIEINKIIFSGRSTFFPLIKETVESNINSDGEKVKSIFLNMEESKTAVVQGACWYGINKNSILLNNLKTNASFGFKRTKSADKTDVQYHELVKMGLNFDTRINGINSFNGVENIVDDFARDSGKVDFFQVMGKNANRIFSEGQMHKFSKIATIKPDKLTSKIAMKVSENDYVECAVILQSNPNKPLLASGVVADQEIYEANEEHYTWLVN